MNITDHAKLRYVQRIKLIQDVIEAKRYIAQNEVQICDHITKLHEHSTFIWKGQLGDNITRHFYIKDDTIIITDVQNSAIITMYKVDYGYPAPSKLNLTISRELFETVKNLQDELIDLDVKIKDEVELLNLELENINIQKRILTEQLDLMTKKSKAISSEIESIRGERSFKEKEIEKNVILLINSISYREDIKELTNKKIS